MYNTVILLESIPFRKTQEEEVQIPIESKSNQITVKSKQTNSILPAVYERSLVGKQNLERPSCKNLERLIQGRTCTSAT